MNYSNKKLIEKRKALNSTSKKLTTKVYVTFFKAFLYTIILFVVLVSFAGFGMMKGIIDNAPGIQEINIAPSGYSTTIYDSDGVEIQKLITSGSNRVQVSISDIPEHLQYAFIDIEDERFEEHNGIDIKGILRAATVAVTSGNFSEGASTITQQLLKNNVFEGGLEDSLSARFKRKIQEQYLALQLEKEYDKKIILEYYLNTINLGQNTLGVQAASKRYFNKDVSEITISESAVIAAIPQNPSRFNPVTRPEENALRRAKVLDNMLKNGHITDEEYREAQEDDVYSRIQSVNEEIGGSSPYTYFVDELVEQVINDLQVQKGYTYMQAVNALYSGGLSIYTTQDSRIQQISDEEISNDANYPANIFYSFTWRWSVTHEDGTKSNYDERTLETYHKTKLGAPAFKLIFPSQEKALETIEAYKEAMLQDGDVETGETLNFTIQPQASFVIMDQKTGHVKAIVGGRGDKEASRTLNRATNTVRQPGSCFKVLSTFAPALDTAGYTLASVEDDAPFLDVNGRPVSNWWRDGYKGLSNMRLGIVRSMNIVTVKTLTNISPQLGFDYLLNFGFTTLVANKTYADGTMRTDIGQALALGGITDGVTNLELTAGYAAIANNGVYTEPIFYTKVLDYNGRVLLERKPLTRTVLKESTAFLLTNAMHGVVTGNGTGTSANVPGIYIAGKTGTTTGNNDIWFSGYSPYYTATIWSGYDENRDIGSNTYYHTRLWSKIMTRVHEGYTDKSYEMPQSVETAMVCRKSGKLAIEGICDHDPEGNMIYQEYFAKGTTPTEVCDAHIRLTICRESNRLATDNCPEQLRTSRVYRVRIKGNEGVTADTPFELPASIQKETCNIHR